VKWYEDKDVFVFLCIVRFLGFPWYPSNTKLVWKILSLCYSGFIFALQLESLIYSISILVGLYGGAQQKDWDVMIAVWFILLDSGTVIANLLAIHFFLYKRGLEKQENKTLRKVMSRQNRIWIFGGLFILSLSLWVLYFWLVFPWWLISFQEQDCPSAHYLGKYINFLLCYVCNIWADITAVVVHLSLSFAIWILSAYHLEQLREFKIEMKKKFELQTALNSYEKLRTDVEKSQNLVSLFMHFHFLFFLVATGYIGVQIFLGWKISQWNQLRVLPFLFYVILISLLPLLRASYMAYRMENFKKKAMIFLKGQVNLIEQIGQLAMVVNNSPPIAFKLFHVPIRIRIPLITFSITMILWLFKFGTVDIHIF